MLRTLAKIVLVILLLFVAGKLMRGQPAPGKLPSIGWNIHTKLTVEGGQFGHLYATLETWPG